MNQLVPTSFLQYLDTKLSKAPNYKNFLLVAENIHLATNETKNMSLILLIYLKYLAQSKQMDKSVEILNQSISANLNAQQIEESEDIRRANKDIEALYRSGKLENIDEKTFNRAKSIIKAYNLLF